MSQSSGCSSRYGISANDYLRKIYVPGRWRGLGLPVFGGLSYLLGFKNRSVLTVR